MTKKLITAAFLSMLAASSWASSFNYYEYDIGGTTFYSGDINGYSQRIGSTTFHSGDINGYSQRIGNTTFHTFYDY